MDEKGNISSKPSPNAKRIEIYYEVVAAVEDLDMEHPDMTGHGF